MGRLFISMATADVLYHIGLFGHAFSGLYFGVQPRSQEMESSTCHIAWIIYFPTRLLSVFHEVVISVYCLCIAFNWRKLLMMVSRSVPLLWILGVGLVVLNMFE